MNEKIFTATDAHSVTMWSAVAIAVILSAILVYLYKIKDKKENKILRQVGAMLVFYGVLMSIGTAIFSYWNNAKAIDLVFKETSVETAYGTLNYNNIRDARIRVEGQTALGALLGNTTQNNPSAGGSSARRPSSSRGGSTRLLVVVETSGKTHVFSEDNYDIRAVLGEFRKRIPKK